MSDTIQRLDLQAWGGYRDNLASYTQEQFVGEIISTANKLGGPVRARLDELLPGLTAQLLNRHAKESAIGFIGVATYLKHNGEPGASQMFQTFAWGIYKALGLGKIAKRPFKAARRFCPDYDPTAEPVQHVEETVQVDPYSRIRQSHGAQRPGTRVRARTNTPSDEPTNTPETRAMLKLEAEGHITHRRYREAIDTYTRLGIAYLESGTFKDQKMAVQIDREILPNLELLLSDGPAQRNHRPMPSRRSPQDQRVLANLRS